MKLHKAVIAILIFIATLHLDTYANAQIETQQQTRYAKSLDITNGLAHNGVSCQMFDSRGYLWVGTYDGLNRYGGNNIKVYKNSTQKAIFQDNRVRAIEEDNQGRLWVGTEGGVTIFDYDKDSFQKLPIPTEYKSPIINKIFITKDSERVVAISSNSTILIYNMLGELTSQTRLPRPTPINSAIHLSGDIYLLATQDGLVSFDASNSEFQSVKGCCEHRAINTLIKCSDNTIIASYYQGIQLLKLINSNGQYTVEGLSKQLYKANYITALTIDYDGTLWMGCNGRGGLLQIKDYETKLGSTPLLIANICRISDILIDGDEIWVGTLDDGVIELLSSKTSFTSYENENTLLPQIEPFDTERIILYNKHKTSLFNTTTYKREKLPFSLPESLANQRKIFIQGNDSKSTWIVSVTTSNKAELYLAKGNQIKKIESPELSKIFTKSSYKSIPLCGTFDGDGNLWVAYLNNLFRISLDNESVTSVETIWTNKTIQETGELARIRALYYDQQSNVLWVGSNRQGLFKIELNNNHNNLQKNKIEHFRHDPHNPQSLSSDFVSSILRTSNGTLWIGTEQGGLCRVVEADGVTDFETLSESDGLSNNVVKSLCEDHRGNLWISTNIGLNCLNIKNNYFTVYRSTEGLPFEGFWFHSLNLDSGELLFTGTSGLLTFNPEKFYTLGSTPKINFNELKIGNKEIAPNELIDGAIVITERLSNNNTIKLKYDQNVFSVGVDLIRDQYSLSNTLHYRLSPLNKEWLHLDPNRGLLTFNGVKPGRYKLEVCAYNSQGEMGEISTLNIVIAPPIWKSTHAYMLYILVCLLIIFIIVSTLMSFQTLAHNLEIETIEKSVNVEKLRYLSNISHELKTPLALILAPVALLRERFSLDKDVVSKLDIVRRQSKKLLELVDLTHSMEANDLKSLKINRSLFSFNAMVGDITGDFKFLAEYDNKHFAVEHPESDIAVEADRGMVEKIFNNLLSNALKHTLSGDSISLRYRLANNQEIIIEVEDSGAGIDAEDLPHIFERFYQAKRSGSQNIGGTGIGLTFSKMLAELHRGSITAQSRLNIGTTFTITLPIVVDKAIPTEAHENPQLTPANHYIIEDNTAEILIESEYSQSTIYLVEDNQELRQLVSEIIGKHFNVKSFSNGAEVVEQLETEWPDLIVSDIMMPEMDGYELCGRIKGNVKTSHIPVILLTACGSVDDQIKGSTAGADSYITKPFYPKHLITRIEALLHSRQQLRERFQVGIPLVYGKDANTSAKDNEFMEKLYELFNEHMANEDIDLDIFARELGQNRTMFFKKVKSVTDSSPYELLKEYRLKRACEMLQSGDYNVNEVSTLTGFKSRSHFSRTFKERYDISPSQYHKQNNVDTK